MEYTDYLVILQDYLPIFLYTIITLTFLPKTWRRIKTRAEQNLDGVRYHRCHGDNGLCCHPRTTITSRTNCIDLNRLNFDRGSETETNTRAEPFQMSTDDGKQADETRSLTKLINQLERKSSFVKEDQQQIWLQQKSLQTAANVTQIKKMFEGNSSTSNGGVADRKVNRVTPILNMKPISEQYFESDYKPKKAQDIPAAEFQEIIKDNIENSSGVLYTEEVVWRRHKPTHLPLSRDSSSSSIGATPSKYNSCSPVNSIEEIIAQRRFSRPLSAYSISDLLGDSLPDEVYIDNFLKNLHK